MAAPSSVVVSVVAAQLCAPVPGGTGRYTRELLVALERGRMAVDDLVALLPPGCSGPSGVRSGRLLLPPRILSRLWERGLPPTVGGADVVHAPTLLVPSLKKPAALVVTVHDVVPWTHPDTLTARGVRFHHRMGQRAAAEADAIVTPTEVVADAVRAVLSPRCPVLVVPPGVGVVPPTDEEGHERRPSSRNRPYALFVGTAEPRKGLDALVRAFTRPAVDDLDLVVVGPPGWGDVDVTRLATAAGLGGRVTVTGRVTNEELSDWYVGARVVVVPSRAEGFGLPVVEAMALGTPVVTSLDPALREVGAQATTAVDAEDPDVLAGAIAEAASDGDRRALMTRRGRARAADFSWSRTASAMWDLYRAATRGDVSPAA